MTSLLCSELYGLRALRGFQEEDITSLGFCSEKAEGRNDGSGCELCRLCLSYFLVASTKQNTQSYFLKREFNVGHAVPES